MVVQEGQEKKSGAFLGFISILIIFLISYIGYIIEYRLNIGFNFLGLKHVTFIPFLLGVIIVILITNKVKKEGKFDRLKFWLGFFMPFIIILVIGLLAFGACFLMLGPWR